MPLTDPFAGGARCFSDQVSASTADPQGFSYECWVGTETVAGLVFGCDPIFVPA